ncbi:MAG TPA: lysophospholipid acyltransferase family protein [Tepidisphaeraceae bacterium]
MGASRRNERRPEDRFALRGLRAVNVFVARIYHKLEVLSPQRLPKEGAAILVCNHTSGLDPLLIQSVCSRLIVWMMAAEYYEIRPLRWVFDEVGIIPTTRSGRDTAATRAALRGLHAGRVLGIFPEGKIESKRELLPFQVGVALLAIKTGVPVYPAYLDGTQRGQEMPAAFIHRNEATLRFGPAVKFDRSGTSKEHLEAATEKIRGAVGELMNR